MKISCSRPLTRNNSPSDSNMSVDRQVSQKMSVKDFSCAKGMNFKTQKLYNRKSAKPSYEKNKNDDNYHKSKSVERYMNCNFEYKNSNTSFNKAMYSLKNSRNGSRKKIKADKSRNLSKIWIYECLILLLIFFII